MNTDELTRLYQTIHVGDDNVQNVLDAMPGGGAVHADPTRFRLPRVQTSVVTAAVLVVLIASLVYVSVRPGETRHGPTGHSPAPTSTRPAPNVVLPARRPDTLSGAVTNHGRPLPGAYVTVTLQPNSSVLSHVKIGQTVPTKRLPVVRSDAHGGFVVTLGKPNAVSRRFREGNFINFEIDVTAGNHTAEWNETFNIHHDTAAPIQMIFDIGARTIRVNGHESKLPIE